MCIRDRYTALPPNSARVSATSSGAREATTATFAPAETRQRVMAVSYTHLSTTRMDGLFMNVHLTLRQCKGKDTAIGNVVSQGQCSAVSRQDRTAEGQAQSKAAVAVCNAALPGIKHLEHLCFCAIRNAGTVICLSLIHILPAQTCSCVKFNSCRRWRI